MNKGYRGALMQGALVATVLPAAALLLIGALTPVSIARAQMPVDECAGKASQAEEIACLRRALAASRGSATPDQAGIPAPARGKAATAPTPAPKRDARVAQKPEQRAVPAPAPAPRPAAQASAVANMGAEQLAGPRRKDAEAKPAMQAVVVASEEDHEGLLMLHLDSGQRWKQVERPSLQIIVKKGNNYPVEISRSGFGGYRMYFPNMHRTIVVKRIS